MIVKRYGHVCYSAIKPPMAMLFWNIQNFEHLEMILKSWLDKDINDGDKLEVSRDLFCTSQLQMTMMLHSVYRCELEKTVMLGICCMH